MKGNAHQSNSPSICLTPSAIFCMSPSICSAAFKDSQPIDFQVKEKREIRTALSLADHYREHFSVQQLRPSDLPIPFAEPFVPLVIAQLLYKLVLCAILTSLRKDLTWHPARCRDPLRSSANSSFSFQVP